MDQFPIPTTLSDDLAQVDALIAARLAPRAAVLQVAGPHIFAPKGVRIRAALTLLCAQLGAYAIERVVHSAAAVELIHAASLVHDGLIDDAERRRGEVAGGSRWNGDVALMVGDYLFALAAAEMALAPDPRIIAYFSRGVMAICEGELAPVLTLAPLDTALEQYLYKAGCKTAALFEATCKAGLACGGGTPEQIEALGRFGYHLGLAFQIIEDVLDYTVDAATLGKAPGSALRAGTITLPLIYAVHAHPDPALATIIDLDQPNEERFAWAISEVQRSDAGQRARAEAQRYMELGLRELNGFPDSAAREALNNIARFIIARTV